jgi:hypothetical protein
VDLGRAFGAIERGLYVAMLAWLVLVAAAGATGHLVVAPGWHRCGPGAGICHG